MIDAHPAWTNWARNQSFDAEVAAAGDEADVRRVVAECLDAHGGVRVAGSGHSFTPIVEPRTTLLRLDGDRGVIDSDAGARTAEVWAHTPLRELGPALWERGLALRNQGDTDSQTIAGATATGTKGSGRALGSLSSEIRAVTLVDGAAELRRIDGAGGPHAQEQLRAAQLGLGLLGIVTRLQLHVDDAYGLEEHNSSDPLDTVLDTVDADSGDVRHYSFCWCPSDETSARFAIPDTPADHCWVKRLITVPSTHRGLQSASVSGAAGRRVGRAYAIYPDWADQDPEHIELEYMVPSRRWREAFDALRALMLHRFPDEHSMVQVRWQAADDVLLSAQHHAETVSLAVVSDRLGDYHRFLRAVHETLMPFDPRPHWGKMHYFTPSEIARAFPARDRFLAVRQELDPAGVFANPALSDLLAIPTP